MRDRGMDPRRLRRAGRILPAGLFAACWILPAAAQPARDRVLEIVALEDARSLGEGRLEAWLLDPDHEVRRQAALALGRIGRPEVVPPLVRALAEDEAGAVRASAAFALGIVEDSLPEDAALALAAALADPSDRVRERVVEALGRRGGPDAAEILARVLAERVEIEGYADRRENIEVPLRRSSWDRARLALFALARIRDDGGDPGEVAPLLGIDGSPRTGWWPAAWTVARLGDPALAPLSRAYAESADPLTRALGLRGLGKTGLPVADEIAANLAQPSEMVRIEAIRAISALAASGNPPRAGHGLLEALEDASPAIRSETLEALAHISAPGSAERLVDLLGDPDPATRAAATRALHRQDPEGFWLLLAGWSDRDPLARLAMIRQIGEIRDPQIRSFLLGAAHGDPDSRARAAALIALGTLESGLPEDERSPEAKAMLVLGLEAEDPHERAAAARALGITGAGLEELRSAYHEDGSPDFRLAAVRAVLRLDQGPNRRAFAEAALEDPSWPVRSEAHRFLRREGFEPPPPAPAPAMDPEDYAPTVHASFTPVAWIDTRHGAIELELLVADAPRTALNFMRLAREGFYDGLSFHRVVPNFVVQAGDPRADMAGGPGYAIRSEINERRYARGTLGMANDGKDTGGSQFFITLLPQPHRNGRHTVFGQVRSGFPVLDRIEAGDRIRRIRIWDGVTPPR